MTRVLLVEDERGIQIALSGLLKKEGYEVDIASNADDAMQKLASETYDAVLTDRALGELPEFTAMAGEMSSRVAMAMILSLAVPNAMFSMDGTAMTIWMGEMVHTA